MRFIIFLVFLFLPFFSESKDDDILSLEQLYIQKKCITCHVVGRGRFVGPDLYNVFDKYTESEIAQWIKNPQEIYKKKNKMPINDGYPPMPYMNVNNDEAKKLIKYIKLTRKSVKKGTKVSIKGNILNFTRNEPLNNQKVELESVMADKVTSKDEIVTNQGEFIFKKLLGNIAYRIKIFYDGIEYSTDKFYFLPRENEKKVELTVYESTQDKKNISIKSSHFIISYDEDANSIVFAEIVNIENKSRSIFVGQNDFSEKVRKINSYPLFPKITNLGFPHRSRDTFIISEDSVTDTLPMPPGNRRVVFTYVKNLNLFSTKLSRVFLNDIDSLTLIVPQNKLSMEINGLNYTKKKSEIADLPNEEYTTYSLVNIKKGDQIELVFKKYDIFQNSKVITFTIFVIFIFGIFLYKRSKKFS